MLTLQNTDSIRRIEAAIGYTFRDKRLLVQVFTRKTYMKVDPEAPDNEVLEFYGDMLMSYHVTTYFIEKFAHMLNDGLYFMRTVEQFTEMRSHYVRNQYLTERIKQLIPNIDRLVRAQNPRIELPKDNQKAYADLFESLIGAVYLDSYRDDDLIRAFILRHLNIEPKAEAETTERAGAGRRSTRTVVLPSVSLVDREPEEIDEDMSMDVPALVEELPAAAAEAVSATVEEPADTTAVAIDAPTAEETVPEAQTLGVLQAVTAEKAAAEDSIAEESSTVGALSTPCQDELAAFCREVGYESPVYGETPKNAPHARPVAACTVRFRNKRGKPVKISLNDSGRTIAEATEKAAAKMLKKLRDQRAEEETRAVEAVPALKEPLKASVDTLNKASVEAPAEVMETPAAALAEAPAETPTEVPVEAPAETSAEVPATKKAPARRRKAASKPEAGIAPTPKTNDAAAKTVEGPAVPQEESMNGNSPEVPDDQPAKKSSAKKAPTKKTSAKKIEAQPSDVIPETVAETIPTPTVEAAAEPVKKPRKRAPAKKAAKAENDIE